jgi:hypothetical protein
MNLIFKLNPIHNGAPEWGERVGGYIYFEPDTFQEIPLSLRFSGVYPFFIRKSFLDYLKNEYKEAFFKRLK